MSRRVQLACAWCGPIFAVLLFAGMLCSGLLPPPSPSNSADQVASFWSDHPDLTRFGLLLILIGGGLTAPVGVAIAVMLKRIEGRESPMAYLQLIGAAAGVVAILVPTMIFMAAAFRPGRAPELQSLINDLAWIPFIINFPPAIMQCLSVAVAVLGDKSERPVFPRWVGYYNLWTAVGFLPGGLIIFFKHGAFAWNGLLGFWLAAVLFGGWFITMSVMLMRAAKAREAVPAAAVPQPA